MPITRLDTFTKHVMRRGTPYFPHQLAFMLDSPMHRALAKPGQVAEKLDLTGSERVLELGPGPGLFSVEIARRLSSGRLEQFDLQPEMLDKSRRKLEGAGCRNVGFHAGEASDGLPFPDSTFDRAFLAAVIGEVPDQAACLQSVHRVLKPGGLLIFAERFPDPDRLSVAELRRLAEPAGLEFLDASGNRWQDVVRFSRP
jgi:arsenite methyltransferase